MARSLTPAYRREAKSRRPRLDLFVTIVEGWVGPCRASGDLHPDVSSSGFTICASLLAARPNVSIDLSGWRPRDWPQRRLWLRTGRCGRHWRTMPHALRGFETVFFEMPLSPAACTSACSTRCARSCAHRYAHTARTGPSRPWSSRASQSPWLKSPNSISILHLYGHPNSHRRRR